jgi:hypothetical protein
MKKKVAFRKRFFSRYVFWLEALGFLFIGILIAGMIGSALYEIDDVMKFAGVPAKAHREPVAMDLPVYVKSVAVAEGAPVAKGQTLMAVSGSSQTVALIEATAATRKALDTLGEPPAGDETQTAMAASLKETLERSVAALEKEASRPVTAPIDGILEAASGQPWQRLSGRIVSGTVATVRNYESLRLSAPVTGDNALRVRMNLLAENDVLDWKALTRDIRSEYPPQDPAARRVWEMLQGKLEEIRPGKRPLKRAMPEIVGALNELLRRSDFWDPHAWAGKTLPAEARALLERERGKLNQDELIRLNRLLLRAAMPDAIGVSRNVRQNVKAKLYVPVERRTPDGNTVKEKPLVYPATGQVVHEPEGGKVVIDLVAPPSEVVDYVKRREGQPDLPPVTASGSVVVGKISLFRFLFK